MKKKITAVIRDGVFDFYYETFKKPEEGARYVLECFPQLYRRTMKELAGIFNRNELYMIIDALEGMAVSPEESGKCLPGECFEAMDKDGLGNDWNIEDQDFRKKLDLLTPFQAACLEMWAFAYWYGSGVGSQGPRSDSDLEKHVEVLL